MTDTQRIREKHERWKDAPEWAEWCAIHDGDGSIRWLRQKPDIEGNPDYDFEPRPHPDEIALLERVDALETLIDECEPYLKDHETPAQCIERNRQDVSIAMGMLLKSGENETMKDRVERMAQRFLTWQLPDSFDPDGSILRETKTELTGTNLLTADQAIEMLSHVARPELAALLERDADLKSALRAICFERTVNPSTLTIDKVFEIFADHGFDEEYIAALEQP